MKSAQAQMRTAIGECIGLLFMIAQVRAIQVGTGKWRKHGDLDEQ